MRRDPGLIPYHVDHGSPSGVPVPLRAHLADNLDLIARIGGDPAMAATVDALRRACALVEHAQQRLPARQAAARGLTLTPGAQHERSSVPSCH